MYIDDAHWRQLVAYGGNKAWKCPLNARSICIHTQKIHHNHLSVCSWFQWIYVVIPFGRAMFKEWMNRTLSHEDRKQKQKRNEKTHNRTSICIFCVRYCSRASIITAFLFAVQMDRNRGITLALRRISEDNDRSFHGLSFKISHKSSAMAIQCKVKPQHKHEMFYFSRDFELYNESTEWMNIKKENRRELKVRFWPCHGSMFTIPLAIVIVSRSAFKKIATRNICLSLWHWFRITKSEPNSHVSLTVLAQHFSIKCG